MLENYDRRLISRHDHSAICRSIDATSDRVIGPDKRWFCVGILATRAKDSLKFSGEFPVRAYLGADLMGAEDEIAATDDHEHDWHRDAGVDCL